MLSGRDMAFSTGQMEVVMRGCGSMMSLKERGFLHMEKEMFIKESLRTIWQMEKASTQAQMGTNIRVCSKMTYKKARVKKSGVMALNLKETFQME